MMAEVHDKVSAEELNTAASGLSNFSASLLKAVAESEGSSGNIFISPFSVAAVTSMAFAGAKGNTAHQIKSALHFNNLEDAKIANAVGHLVQSIKGDENYTLEAANKMYVAENYELLEHFQSAVKSYFGVEAQSVDFTAEGTCDKINLWVEDVTHQKIKNLIPRSALTSLTRLVLVNAVYFKGKWLNRFAEAKTKVAPFYLGSTENTIDVDMMSHSADFRHGELQTVDARVLELPYEGHKLSMFIILPNKVDGLAELESKLISENVLGSLNTALGRPAKIQVSIPKFKLEASVEMVKHLKSLGMADIFDESEADLSGISGKRDLFVSNVFHKAFIEVNEEGSEAAAATGMIMMTRMMPIQFDPPPPFVADHPFIFVIRENISKAVLFVGRLAKPNSK